MGHPAQDIRSAARIGLCAALVGLVFFIVLPLCMPGSARQAPSAEDWDKLAVANIQSLADPR